MCFFTTTSLFLLHVGKGQEIRRKHLSGFFWGGPCPPNGKIIFCKAKQRSISLFTQCAESRIRLHKPHLQRFRHLQWPNKQISPNSVTGRSSAPHDILCSHNVQNHALSFTNHDSRLLSFAKAQQQQKNPEKQPLIQSYADVPVHTTFLIPKLHNPVLTKLSSTACDSRGRLFGWNKTQWCSFVNSPPCRFGLSCSQRHLLFESARSYDSGLRNAKCELRI